MAHYQESAVFQRLHKKPHVLYILSTFKIWLVLAEMMSSALGHKCFFWHVKGRSCSRYSSQGSDLSDHNLSLLSNLALTAFKQLSRPEDFPLGSDTRTVTKHPVATSGSDRRFGESKVTQLPRSRRACSNLSSRASKDQGKGRLLVAAAAMQVSPEIFTHFDNADGANRK